MVGWCVIPSTFHHKNKEVTRWIIGVTRDSEKMVTRRWIGEKKEEVGDEWREINAKKVTWVAGSIPPPKKVPPVLKKEGHVVSILILSKHRTQKCY